MVCFHPVTAYRLINEKTENGKAKIVWKFDELKDHAYEKIDIKCGNCDGCRIDRSRDWAIRCAHEASLYENNCFLTLTIADENLEHDERKCKGCRIYSKTGQVCSPMSLCRKDFQLFMKRLRKYFNESRIRFYHCGEYGSKMSRPHHHACLFGFDFPDKVLWKTRDQTRLYRSEILEKLWRKGYSCIGDVTFESAAYVARYIAKKYNGEKREEHYRLIDNQTGEIHQLQPEFTTMSRRPGIGAEWFKRFKGDVFPKDYVTHKGRKLRSPKYYDDLFEREDPEGFNQVKKVRRAVAIKTKGERSGYRLRARERVLRARMKRLVREVEL